MIYLFQTNRLFVLYACLSENKYIGMRQLFCVFLYGLFCVLFHVSFFMNFSRLCLRIRFREAPDIFTSRDSAESGHLRSHFRNHTGSDLLRTVGKLRSADLKACSKRLRDLLIL